MRVRIGRQTIYLLAIAFVLLITVLLFAFLLLIPEGKAYRTARSEMKKHALELTHYQQWHDETLNKLKELQSKNKQVIRAFENSFDSERFIKINQSYFEDLKVSRIESLTDENQFAVYEVNVSSKIDSPQSFFSFLEGGNKSDWIIGINFPIHFERVDSLIISSFTMKVYALPDNTKEK